MFAIVTACIEFSSDWAGEIIGAIFCNAFGITTKDMSNYPNAILVKVGLLLFVIQFIRIIPTNEEIHELSKQINPDEDEKEDENENEKQKKE